MRALCRTDKLSGLGGYRAQADLSRPPLDTVVENPDDDECDAVHRGRPLMCLPRSDMCSLVSQIAAIALVFRPCLLWAARLPPRHNVGPVFCFARTRARGLAGEAPPKRQASLPRPGKFGIEWESRSRERWYQRTVAICSHVWPENALFPRDALDASAMKSWTPSFSTPVPRISFQ